MGYHLRSSSANQTMAAGKDEVNRKPVLPTVRRPARIVKPLPPKQPKRPCYAKWSAEQMSARINVLKAQIALFEEAKHRKVKEWLSHSLTPDETHVPELEAGLTSGEAGKRDNSLVVEFMLQQGLDRTTIGVLIHEAAKYTAANAV